MTDKGIPITTRNGLKVYKPLRAKKSLNKVGYKQNTLNKANGKTLKSKTPLNKVSAKQHKENREWAKTLGICFERADFTCEVQGKDCVGKYGLTGHHIVSRAHMGANNAWNCILGCAECHNHHKYAQGIPLSREEALELVSLKNNALGIK